MPQRALDSCSRLTIAGVSTYGLFGALGYAIGFAIAAIAATELEFAAVGWAVVAVVPLASLFATFALARRGWWRGPIVFHEKAIIAIASTAVALAAFGEPVAPGVDVVALGIGAFLAVGRIGCLNAGCCHGRRARRGVRYRWEHAALGFPERWVGLTLFPIQLVDAAVSAGAVAAGFFALGTASPGAAASAYACVYGVGRFVVERFRGDGSRNQRAGLTEAQWAMFAIVAFAALATPTWWTIASVSLLAIASLAVVTAWRLKRWPSLWLTCGWHLVEIEAALGGLVADRDRATTPGGLRLRLASVPDGTFELELALRQRPLPERAANAVARQLGRDWTVTEVGGSTVRLSAGVSTAALSD